MVAEANVGDELIPSLVTETDDALDIFDLEQAARRPLGMSVEIFGGRYGSLIYLSALGAQKAFAADGELGAARAAKAH